MPHPGNAQAILGRYSVNACVGFKRTELLFGRVLGCIINVFAQYGDHFAESSFVSRYRILKFSTLFYRTFYTHIYILGRVRKQDDEKQGSTPLLLVSHRHVSNLLFF